jgi:hypothetical protein
VGLGISTTSLSSPLSFKISSTDEVLKVEGIDGLEVVGKKLNLQKDQQYLMVVEGYLVHWIVMVEYLLHLMMVAEFQL